MKTLIILFILLSIYNIPAVKGAIGEAIVRLYLLFLDKERYVSYHDLYITKKDGSTTQLDHVVVSPFGIFVIETKNYTGWIFGSETGKYWTQTIYRSKHKFYNPIAQNRGHIKHLIEFLQYDNAAAYNSIIVFTMRATFKNLKVKTKVIYAIRLVSTIKQFKQVVISPEEFQAIKVQMDSIGKANWKTRRNHVKAIRNYDKKKVAKNNEIEDLHEIEEQASINNQMTDLEDIVPIDEKELVCPRCGAKLVERVGKKGKYAGQKFMGCSSFPKCRYIKN